MGYDENKVLSEKIARRRRAMTSGYGWHCLRRSLAKARDFYINEMIFLSTSPIETQEYAAKLACGLKKGSILALTGELGAGKTCFVQGLAKGLGVSKRYYVNSPTFTILNIYEGGKMPIYHFDWYRLVNEAEAIDLGLEEYFDGKGLCVIEWAEKFPNLLPSKSIWVKMEVAGENKRKITMEHL